MKENALVFARQIALVFVGGGVGSLLRFLVQLGLGATMGVLAVNLLGSLLIGYLTEKYLAQDLWRVFLCTGILGGFTTFSAFSYEVLKLSTPTRSAVYIFVSVIGSVVLCAVGRNLALRFS